MRTRHRADPIWTDLGAVAVEHANEVAGDGVCSMHADRPVSQAIADSTAGCTVGLSLGVNALLVVREVVPEKGGRRNESSQPYKGSGERETAQSPVEQDGSERGDQAVKDLVLLEVLACTQKTSSNEARTQGRAKAPRHQDAHPRAGRFRGWSSRCASRPSGEPSRGPAPAPCARPREALHKGRQAEGFRTRAAVRVSIARKQQKGGGRQ